MYSGGIADVAAGSGDHPAGADSPCGLEGAAPTHPYLCFLPFIQIIVPSAIHAAQKKKLCGRDTTKLCGFSNQQPSFSQEAGASKSTIQSPL